MVKCTGRGLVVKRPGVLSKVQMLNLVLGVGVFSLLPILASQILYALSVGENQHEIGGQDFVHRVAQKLGNSWSIPLKTVTSLNKESRLLHSPFS